MPTNPYAAYKAVERKTVSGRGLEIRVLEKAAFGLSRCRQNWSADRVGKELDDALQYNKKVWDIFLSDWQSDACTLPAQIRQNLLSLGLFVRKTTLDILSDPKAEKLDSLIQINEHLVEGLRSPRPEQTPAS